MLKFTALLTLLWLPALLVGYDKFGDFFFWRSQLTMYTGILSLGYMSLAVLLAARFSWVESKVKGLDKGYALHKTLGIGATIALILHWVTVKSAHWLIDAQLIAMPDRGPRPTLEGINWREIAEQVGDVSFKVFLIFSLISLVQTISYKKFKFTHKLGGILVLAGVFHSMMLLNWDIASIPMNSAITALSVIGVWCSFMSLFGRIGNTNKVKGNISQVTKFALVEQSASVARFTVQLDNAIHYKEGQFAYLDFHDGEAPHPFSILDYDKDNRLVSFGVKDLGDYTHQLVNKLEAGQAVTIEGSYGRFQMSGHEHQVWVGAGIGIVPFISRLYWLKRKADKTQPSLKKIELFYCVNSKREAFFEHEIIKILNHLDFIKLHLLDAKKGEMLDGEQIATIMAGKTYDVSFCGPKEFGKNLQKYLAETGLPEGRFHKEIFKMR